MRNELEEIETIEKYLEGKLTPQEKAAFEQRLRTDGELKEVLELQKMIVERIETGGFKDVIRKVHVTKYNNGFNFGMSIVVTLICIGSAYAGWSYLSHNNEPVKTTTAHTKIESTKSVPHKAVETKTSLTADKPEVSVKNKIVPAAASAPGTVKQTVAHYGAHTSTVIAAPVVSQAHVSSDSVAKNTRVIEQIEKSSIEFNNKNFVIPFNKYSFVAETGGTFTDSKSGTRITVPAGILVQSNGKPVQGNVKLHYREFRDAADMAYSGIPMTYKQGDSTDNFNSAGMFELYVLRERDTFRIRSGSAVRVDFVMTQNIPGLAFYGLKRKENSWKEIGKIQTDVAVPASADAKKTKIKITMTGNPVVVEELEVRQEGDTIVGGANVFFANPGTNGKWVRGRQSEWSAVPNGKMDGSLLAEGADAGHTYPNMVKGLVCKDFGVYNCDQVYRMGSVVTVNPVFKDRDGKTISSQNVLTLIDLNYNGSFSFDPHRDFNMNPKSKNVLLLFTKDNKVFAYNEADFSATPITRSGKSDFTMKDVSEEVKNTEDLRRYLGLNK